MERRPLISLVIMRILLPVLSVIVVCWCAETSFAQDTNSAASAPPASPGAPAPIANPTPRQLLAEAILATGDQQTAMIGQLTDTSDVAVVKEILTDWIKGGVYLHQNSDGTMIPFTIEPSGPVQIDNGKPLAATETTPVDTDSHLRRAVRSTLDLLALADPDPNLRRSAVMKLGMMQRASNLPALQARLAKETDGSVRQALEEAISIIGLGDSDPKVQIDAIKKLSALDSISSLDLLKGLQDNGSTPEVQQAAGLAVLSLNNYLFWVNFFGTIFSRSQPRFRTPRGRAWPRHHVRSHGRDQHGPRGADCRRRLCFVCDRRRFRPLFRRSWRDLVFHFRHPVCFHLGGPGGPCTGALYHPLSL